MATKAKYYVEIFGPINRKWFTDPYPTKGGALQRASRMGLGINGLKVRIRRKGRVIARWKNGRRVPQERGQ